MKRIVSVIILVISLISLNPTVHAAQPISDRVKKEWDTALQLIQNYNEGNYTSPVKVDFNEINYNKVYFYVYSVVPERIYLDGNQAEGLWLVSYENQNIKKSAEMAEQIIEEIITDDMTYLEKITAIHDYIINNTVFALDAAQAPTLTRDNIWAFCADGVFLRGSAVCSGYTAAMKMLCSRADIPCYSVNATGINHTWNVVYYEGEWRYIDVSTNDRADDSYGKNNNTTIYNYFLVNQDELSETAHRFDDSTETTVSAGEYIDFLNYYTDKSSSGKPKSVFIQTMRHLAERGNLYAQYQLAYSYKVGVRGVPVDYETSFYWHYKAALRGHVPSQNNVGYFYEHAIGVKGDNRSAFEWYIKAAYNGNDVAQAHVGDCYAQGIGIYKDVEESKRWYQKAANNGNSYAAQVLKSLKTPKTKTMMRME